MTDVFEPADPQAKGLPVPLPSYSLLLVVAASFIWNMMKIGIEKHLVKTCGMYKVNVKSTI